MSDEQIKAVSIMIILCIIVLASNPVSFTEDATGYAVVEVAPEPEPARNATLQDAVDAIKTAKDIMEEMQEAGFNTLYINDLILSAEKTLERAKYIEQLGKQQLTGTLIAKTNDLFEEGSTAGVSYSDVISYTDEISKRKELAYKLHDSLRTTELKAGYYKDEGIGVSNAISSLADANKAFDEERYEDAGQLVSDADASMEANKAEMTFVKAMANAGKSYLQRNWKKASAVFLAIMAFTLFVVLQIRKFKARKKLATLKLEQDVIVKLMKETQKRRFVSGGMTNTSYKIRMDKYKERLNEIKHTIPVLEALVEGKKLKKGKGTMQ
ncbi:MAG: hypothetical protein KJ955_02860 [Nanoarchaeota archaeon]|nr:hypothetical protein [Nanoarchaeota archaeon]